MNSLFSRIVATVVATVAYFGLSSLWSAFRASVEASIAVAQVKDSIVTYTFAQQMVRGNVVGPVLIVLLLLALLLIWRKPLNGVFKGRAGNPSTSALGLLVLVAAAMCAGCMGPAKVLPLDTVGPNETAFVIPMEGDATKQAKFESVDFLKAHKVMSKQIEIPVREYKTGRMPWNYKWIPTVRVIKVDRSLVTREWTKGSSSGTSNKDEALSVASLDSINFHLGVNLTAFITEEDAPTYLYWHGPKPLSDVVDTNVRGFLQGVMSDEFGKLRLEDGKFKKASIFKIANDLTIAKFKEVGITISYVGSAQGLMFDDQAIQTKINETQTAEMAVEVARKKNLEQIELNKAVVSKAIADRQAAEEFAKAAEAQAAKIELDIRMVQARAMAAAADKWNGQMPASILPQGSNILFGLDRPKEDQ